MKTTGQDSRNKLRWGNVEERRAAAAEPWTGENAHGAGLATAFIAALEDGDARVRVEASQSITALVLSGALDPPDARAATRALLARTKDAHPDVRHAAITGVIGLLSPQGPMRPLPTTAAGYAAASRVAAQAVSWPVVMTWPPLPVEDEILLATLAETLDNPDARVRAGALMALGLLGSRPSARPPQASANVRLHPAVLAALRDTSPALRAEGVCALAAFGAECDSRVPVLLREALLDPEFQVHQACAMVLTKAPFKAKLTELLLVALKGSTR